MKAYRHLEKVEEAVDWYRPLNPDADYMKEKDEDSLSNSEYDEDTGLQDCQLQIESMLKKAYPNGQIDEDFDISDLGYLDVDNWTITLEDGSEFIISFDIDEEQDLVDNEGVDKAANHYFKQIINYIRE